MSNSKLVNCTIYSPNHSGRRTHSIDTITPHCVVGQLTAASIGGCFSSLSRKASCNYGIGADGYVCLVVDECNRSWCSSNKANDQRAVTIECASDKTAPYAMTSKVYDMLVKLCADICRRNGKTKLLWLGSKAKTLAYSPKSNEMVLTAHRWFANKSCPGDWLYSRYGDLAKRVNALLAVDQTQTSSSLKVGAVVNYTGCKHYASANATSGQACRPGRAKITQVYQPGKSKHPYHLVAASGGGSTVYGWVDASDISK